MRVNALSIAGGILGLVSVPLPWLLATGPVAGASTGVGASGVDVLLGFGSLGAFGALPAGVDTALLVVFAGVVLSLAGSLAALVDPYGSGFLISGGAFGLAGGLLVGSAFAASGAGNVGPSSGPFLAVSGGVLSAVGLAVPIPRPKKQRRHLKDYTSADWEAGTPDYTQPNWPRPVRAEEAPQARSVPTSTPTVTEPGTEPAMAPGEWAVSAEEIEEEPTYFCPVCGRRMAERYCPVDGSWTRRLVAP
ncbi:MAG TPA: hypothetical protein VJ397_00545 [Thermoplasmata archaeon]|nr:hypothetical protein [Thermoplasmata archaeon]